LDEVYHLGPSVVDLNTLRLAALLLPVPFLDAIGVPPDLVAYLRANGASATSPA